IFPFAIIIAESEPFNPNIDMGVALASPAEAPNRFRRRNDGALSMPRRSLLLALLLTAAAQPAVAQDYSKYTPEALERELATTADSRLTMMVPMRDGVRLSTNIYTPKGASGRLPVILWKTPYNEHKPRGSSLRYAIEAVRRGYVF